MKSLSYLFAVSLLFSASVCRAQSTETAAPADSQAAQDNAIRGSFGTILEKGLDSKKLKDGDPVICRTIGPIHSRSGLLIPTGSKVIGHVTQATARGKGDSDSSLAMVFDKIEISKGKEVPMKGILQAVAPSLPGSGGPNTGADIGGSNMGKSSSGMSGTGANAATSAPPTQTVGIGSNSSSSSSHPYLNSKSEGVLGFRDLTLDKNSVLTSSGKEVKLDSGTQIMIHAEIEVPVQ